MPNNTQDSSFKIHKTDADRIAEIELLLSCMSERIRVLEMNAVMDLAIPSLLPNNTGICQWRDRVRKNAEKMARQDLRSL